MIWLQLYQLKITQSYYNNLYLVSKEQWNKYQSKVIIQRQNQYLCYLMNPSLELLNRFFVFTEQISLFLFLLNRST